MERNAFLILENGTLLKGISIGVLGHVTGEIVFNTAHVGYQEALTDPSYAGQLLLFTSPHIGNIGCNPEDEESPYIWASGLIVREKPTQSNYWRSKTSLQEYLVKHGIVGIAEVDTRYLTRLLVKEGSLKATIVTNQISEIEAKKLATNYKFSSLEQLDRLSIFHSEKKKRNSSTKLVIYDFGIKKTIINVLEKFSFEIIIVPYSTICQKILDLRPDGILLSNGPGNPQEYTPVIQTIKSLLNYPIPMLGICLGHQLLGLALDAKIEKLKFGHHGINHPIREEGSKDAGILFTVNVLVSSSRVYPNANLVAILAIG